MPHEASLSLSFEVMALEQFVNRLNPNNCGWIFEIDVEIVIHLNEIMELSQNFKRADRGCINFLYQRRESLIIKSKVSLPNSKISS